MNKFSSVIFVLSGTVHLFNSDAPILFSVNHQFQHSFCLSVLYFDIKKCVQCRRRKRRRRERYPSVSHNIYTYTYAYASMSMLFPIQSIHAAGTAHQNANLQIHCDLPKFTNKTNKKLMCVRKMGTNGQNGVHYTHVCI